jgi:dipeptidyl aminopeptidase/acylaminoacyl peptidase
MDLIQKRRIYCFFLLLLGAAAGLIADRFTIIVSTVRTIKHRATTAKLWKSNYVLAEIPSSYDGKIQRAYFYGAERSAPLIVSLHAWSSDYREYDPLAELCRSEGWNYIHPDFRGPNNTPASMLSDAAVKDIDDAVAYAIEKGKVDTDRIVVTGHSGGGLAALGVYARSAYTFKFCMAWCPISDLEAWYYQSGYARTKYRRDIAQAVGSDAGIDNGEARKRSPLYYPPPPPRN